MQVSKSATSQAGSSMTQVSDSVVSARINLITVTSFAFFVYFLQFSMQMSVLSQLRFTVCRFRRALLLTPMALPPRYVIVVFALNGLISGL